MNRTNSVSLRRKVVTGNPSLGTYDGYVHTFKDASTLGNLKYGATRSKKENDFSKMVAICGVPPEQVPEGVLSFARSYRSHIRHVRVVIMADDDSNGIRTSQEHLDGNPPRDSYPNSRPTSKTLGNISKPWSVSSSFAEDAAAILADEAKIQSLEDGPGASHKQYLILILLDAPQAAQSFVQNLDKKPFNNFEKDVIASVYHVSELEGLSMGGGFHINEHNQQTLSPHHKNTRSRSSSSVSLDRQPSRSLSTNMHEVNNCPVCLEPMELNRDAPSIFTTVCNHTFHMHCLLKCENAPCPVCRFDHAGINETLSQCHICRSTERIFVCLICGVASCATRTPGIAGSTEDSRSVKPSRDIEENSRNRNEDSSESKEDCSCRRNALSGGHAWQHYNETLHAYAVDTESQHVWDFAGQGFVHRLIQNADDGKIVEVADPNTTSQERSLIPALTDAEEGEVVHRKLEGYASEYYKLLKDQLNQQQEYFEGILQQIRREYEINTKKSKDTARSPSDLISALKQDMNHLQQRHHTLEKKSNKVAESITFLKNMNESLEANKEPMKKEIEKIQSARKQYNEVLKRQLPKLEERVMELMLEL